MFAVTRFRPALAFAAIAAAILAAPFGWRAALAWSGREAAQLARPSRYLPALDDARERRPFDPAPIEALKQADPAYVLIGDSMAGRVDFARFEELAHGTLAPILQNATGSAYWYLVFKNYVVRSGIRPKWVIVFFRDTNLTDPMFRTGDSTYRHLDEVALDREDELNAVIAARVDPWFRVHRWISRTYGLEAARAWVEPKISAWAASHVIQSRRRQPVFLQRVNEMFSLEHLRPTPVADVEAAEDRDADFGANVKTSALPLFLQLARAHDLHLCFVRVLRRPRDGHPEPQSPQMDRYVRDMREYLEAHGAVLRDDRDDPVMATIEYADGDHIGRGERTRYTERFVATTPIFK